jgi:hypothetical protein
VDPAQVLQTLLNQLAISSQLNLLQSTPLVGQPIGQTPPVICHSKMPEARALMIPNPQPRTLEEQTPETPSAEMQAIEQVSTELKSHMKQELIDHLSEMLQK